MKYSDLSINSLEKQERPKQPHMALKPKNRKIHLLVFRLVKIKLMPLCGCKPCLYSKAQIWEQIHHHMKGCSTSANDTDTNTKLTLSHTHMPTFLLTFFYVSHPLTLLLITVGDLNDPAQWQITINAHFLFPEPGKAVWPFSRVSEANVTGQINSLIIKWQYISDFAM